MNVSIKELNEAIEIAEQTVAELIERRKKLLAMTEEQRLAIHIHKLTCPHNHLDGCTWDYEHNNSNVHDWKATAHKKYLDKATDLLGMSDYDTIIKIIQITKK